mgnify:FL=1
MGLYRSLQLSVFRRIPALYFAWLLRQEKRLPKVSDQPIKAQSVEDGKFEQLDLLGPLSIVDGKIRKVTHRQERMAWLKPVMDKIDILIQEGRRPLVHEVGCGSTINLRILRQIYGKKIELSGSDAYPVQSSEFPIHRWNFTDPVHQHYDLVFSVTALCLASDERGALLNVVMMAKRYAVLVEPLRSTAMPHQQAYLERSGHKCSFDKIATNEGLKFEIGIPALPFSIKHPSAFLLFIKS